MCFCCFVIPWKQGGSRLRQIGPQPKEKSLAVSFAAYRRRQKFVKDVFCETLRTSKALQSYNVLYIKRYSIILRPPCAIGGFLRLPKSQEPQRSALNQALEGMGSGTRMLTDHSKNTSIYLNLVWIGICGIWREANSSNSHFLGFFTPHSQQTCFNRGLKLQYLLDVQTVLFFLTLHCQTNQT